MASVADVIGEAMAEQGAGRSAIHETIHGTTDPASIERQLDQFIGSTMASGVRAALFHVASVGSVTGVVLDDGRRVTVKAYQRQWGRSFLTAVVDVQAALVAAGLACADPITGPRPFGRGWATIESFLADPGQPAEFGPDEMRASARGLAALIAVAPDVPALHDHPFQRPLTSLYPTPHAPVFDFDATARGAEWIDELAAVARPHLDSGRRVVARPAQPDREQ